MDFINKHIEKITIIGILVICYLLFFYNMGNYPLIDVDETRYVSIAKDMLNINDWSTLRLNGEFFFEKPPLYFWLLDTFFLIFGRINEVVARLPIALCATLTTFLVYFMGKKIVSRNYGLISCLIMATSFEFLVLARISILDMLLATLTAFACFIGFLTFFAESEKRKMLLWWAFYLISGFAVLAKGVPGFIIPFGVMFLGNLVAGRIKEIFKPVYCLPGLAIFLLVTIPWHALMLNSYGDTFFHEYIYKHHLERFVNSAELGRKEPFWFFIAVFAVGFLPWTLVFVSMLIDRSKAFFKKSEEYFSKFSIEQLSERWEKLDDTQKWIGLNVIFFAFTFLFFSVSSTKLPTYILPVFPPAAMLLGLYLTEYVSEGKYLKNVNLAVIILNSVFVAVAVVSLFTGMFLSGDIDVDFSTFRAPIAILLTVFPMAAIFAAIVKHRKTVFITQIIIMVGLAIIAANQIFNFICNFGENDLVEYALKAKEDKVKLASYNFGKRYSLIYYYDNKISFQTENDVVWLKNYFEKNPKGYVILKLKNIQNLDGKIQYKVLDSGRKYCLIKKN